MEILTNKLTGLTPAVTRLLDLKDVTLPDHGLHVVTTKGCTYVDDANEWKMGVREAAVAVEGWQGLGKIVNECRGLLFAEAMARGMEDGDSNCVANLAAASIERSLGVVVGGEGLMFSELLHHTKTSATFLKGFLTLLHETLLPDGLNLRNIISHGYLHPVPLPYVNLLVVLSMRVHAGIYPKKVVLVPRENLLGPLERLQDFVEGCPVEEFQRFPFDDARHVPNGRLDDLKKIVKTVDFPPAKVVFEIVPILEMMVRSWYCVSLGDAAFSRLQTEIGVYFATLDGHGQRHEHAVMLHEPPLTTLLPPSITAILKDLFLSEDGPGLRGYIMHGKYDWNTIYSSDQSLTPCANLLRAVAILLSTPTPNPTISQWISSYPSYGLYSGEALVTPAVAAKNNLAEFLRQNNVRVELDRVYIGGAKVHDDMVKGLRGDVGGLKEVFEELGVGFSHDDGLGYPVVEEGVVTGFVKSFRAMKAIEEGLRGGDVCDPKWTSFPPCQKQILREVNILCSAALSSSRTVLSNCASGASLRTNQRRSLYRTHFLLLPSVLHLSALSLEYVLRPGLNTPKFTKLLFASLTLTTPHVKTSFSPDRLHPKLQLIKGL